MSIATSAHLTDHDERNWERWNTHQFLNWTKHKYIEINNGDELDEDDLGNLLMTIQSQRINGSSIPYLGIQEFRSMATSAHLTDHDERNWERWNTHQFLNWTKHKYIEINNGDELDEDDLGNLLMTIQSQRINGSSIPYLGIQEFRSMATSAHLT
eukprot:313633_1